MIEKNRLTPNSLIVYIMSVLSVLGNILDVILCVYSIMREMNKMNEIQSNLSLVSELLSNHRLDDDVLF